MLDIAGLIASLAFVALVIAAILALLQARRTARAAELTLAAIEREVRPVCSQLHSLMEDHRQLAQRATGDLKEVEQLTITAREVLARVGRLTSLLGSVGSVGRAVTVAQGVRKGAGVFIDRLSRRRR